MSQKMIVAISVASLLILIAFIVASRKSTGPSSAGPTRMKGASDDILPTVRDTLQKEAGYQSCRKALQQLNTYIDRSPNKRPEPLSNPEGIREQLGLADEELAEVNGSTFTLLDAHYVDSCMMLRNAAYSLGVDGRPPIEKVQIAFGWIVRQIQLREPTRFPVAPSHFVLRRGWGTSLERSLAFLALLQQMEIPGCIIGYPDGAANHRLISWIPGALVDKEIYLFDTRMGLPLPAANGKGIATLNQIRTSEKPFAGLTLDDKHSYDVTPEQARKTEILLTIPLSALAPRMKFLDDMLGGRQKVHSFADWATLLKEFQGATTGQNIPIHFWGENGDPAAPMRILRAFMPSSEGGTDRAPFGLMRQMTLQLVPGFSLPAVIQEQAIRAGEFGGLLANVFWSPFAEFFMDSHGPREMVLRGQLDEASTRLTQMPVILRFREALYSMLAPLSPEEFKRVRSATRQISLESLLDLRFVTAEDVPQRVRPWCDEALKAYADYLTARNLHAAGKISDTDLQAARGQAMKVFAKGEEDLDQLFFQSVTPPLAAEAVFQLALCFHEKASRLQNKPTAKATWRTAANSWNKYITEFPSSPGIPQARLLRAEALRMQGDVPAAVAELKEPISGLTNLQETSRLYQLRQLQ